MASSPFLFWKYTVGEWMGWKTGRRRRRRQWDIAHSTDLRSISTSPAVFVHGSAHLALNLPLIPTVNLKCLLNCTLALQISKAFEDLDQLMEMAKPMVSLAKNISGKIKVSWR